MMGSRANEAPDALTGLLALIANPEQEKAKLQEILRAKAEVDAERTSLRADQAETAQHKADLDALAALVDKREKAVKRRETDADSAKAKNAEASKALGKRDSDLAAWEAAMNIAAHLQADREAEHTATVTAFEQECAARNDAILKQTEAVAEKMAEADQVHTAALELKRNYEQKLAALAAIVKG